MPPKIVKKTKTKSRPRNAPVSGRRRTLPKENSPDFEAGGAVVPAF